MDEENIPTGLIIRYLSNEATTEEAEKLLNWVSEDTSHQRIFTEWSEFWELQLPSPSPFNLAKGLKTINDRIDVHEVDDKIHRRSLSWIRIAASVTLIVMASIAMIVGIPVGDNVRTGPLTVLTTPAGKRMAITLHDGSRVTLNENSTLKYPAVFDKQREVMLTGEAFFEVKKDSLHPFLVRTAELTTQVLGTSFNVQTLPGKITVAVVSGKVNVSKAGESVVLSPEEKVTYSRSTSVMQKGSANLLDVLAWKNPSLKFQDTPLSDVVALLEKQYGITIQFEKESLKNCLMTGNFKNQPLEKVLSAISFSMDVHFRRVDDRFFVYGKGCEK